MAELRKALPGFRAQYGEQHPQTRDAARELAYLEGELSPNKQALNLEEVQESHKEAAIGVDGDLLCELSYYLHEAGQTELAKLLYERTKGLRLCDGKKVALTQQGALILAAGCLEAGGKAAVVGKVVLDRLGDPTEQRIRKDGGATRAEGSTSASSSSEQEMRLGL